jgi:hypothetical protein
MFRDIVHAFCVRFDLDNCLRSLLPSDDSWSGALEARSQSSPRCFAEAHTRLLKSRDQVILPLLARTYSEFPPTPPAAYKHLKLREIETLLDKISGTISYGARMVDHCRECDRSDFIEDQNTQVEFLFDQLYQLTGISAETYHQAVQEYLKLVEHVFPTAQRPVEPSSDIPRLMYSVPAQVGL